MRRPTRTRNVVKHRTAGVLALALACLQPACAHHETGRFQIAKLDLKGQKDLAERPALSCLISRERPRVALTLGLGDAVCGKPPFDSQAPQLNLWRWWWTDWPAFNHAVFAEDLQRIVRWYRARGYYDAKVVGVDFDPPEAADPSLDPPCDLDKKVCKVRITVAIEEGQPTLVRSVTYQGLDDLSPGLVAAIKRLGHLDLDQPIDETEYEQAKKAMSKKLREQGYAQPQLHGRVDVDTAARSAKITFDIQPGSLYTFGKLTLKGQGQLPQKPIVAAANLPTGKRYSPEVLEELQAEVYALGAFSSVQVHESYRPEEQKVDILLELAPHPPHAFRAGVGLLSGAQQRTSTGELTSIPQWDIHLFGRYERRHVLGTLGRLTVEDRPRMIFSEDFPRTTFPKFGNLLSVKLNQPGLIEKRTDLFTENAWDYGPDPFLGFFRHDIYFRVGGRRGFFKRKLVTTVSVQQDLYLVNQDADNVTSDGSELPSTYGYTFTEQDIRVDLRNDPGRPRIGAYFGLNATQAPRWPGSDWTAFRVGPEVRGYLPLFFDIVWASRFSIAALFITDASAHLDDTSRTLGPNAYRLRGGGANSNRGFLAGQLGAGLQGGIRRWEASTELRIPLGENFVIAGFADLGDVNDAPYFRFDHLNFTVGWGLRFYTILGAIRLDTGLRVLSLQRADGSNGVADDDSRLFGAPGALHLTIGDAF